MKKKGLYLCKQNYDFDDIDANAIGIAKKILSQLAILNTNGLETELINYNFATISYLKRWLTFFLSKRAYLKTLINIDFKEIAFIYVRRFSPTDRNFLYMLSFIKKVNKNCRIMYEMPTYPYDKEYTGVKGSCTLFVDRIFRKYLYRYVDYIVTYSNHDELLGVPTIKIVNGIDCSTISPVDATEFRQRALRLIVVAQFSLWHGYDRLIEGLYAYYKNKHENNVFIDFVGEGEVLQQYRKMMSKYLLEQYIVFHGRLTGDALTAVFDRGDIAVCSLGCHRKGITVSSELKSREYMARGLPMISSTKIDMLPDDYPYVQYIPADDSPVDVEAIVNFYNMLKHKESRQQQINNIRAFAENNYDMDITMKPILDKLHG